MLALVQEVAGAAEASGVGLSNLGKAVGAGLTVLGAGILFVESKVAFIALAVGLGLFFGPAQASTRSLMSRTTPRMHGCH